jgi:hypothetical protein
VAGATACTGAFSNVATAASSHLTVSVSYQGSCVLGVVGRLSFDGQSPRGSQSVLRTRVYEHGARVFSGQAELTYSDGSVWGGQQIGVIGHWVCAAAFSQPHPSVRIAGPVCAHI